ncbi:MAG: PadR family transcriptional regulator [Spirochaetes bacterium GWB1_59_5]|nr:MAG: PadR family transcriptional regulator [Spirochaetes bacterium GWB1_59_5]
MPISSSDTLERDLFRGFIPFHILHHAGQEAVFGQALRLELERHGHRLSYGTLYPILHRLEKAGLLHSARSNVAGRLRKYYRLTPVGASLLEKAKPYIRELVDEVLEEK